MVADRLTTRARRVVNERHFIVRPGIHDNDGAARVGSREEV